MQKFRIQLWLLLLFNILVASVLQVASQSSEFSDSSDVEDDDPEKSVPINASGIAPRDVKLFSTLFDKYDKRLRPDANSSNPIDVEIGLLVRRIEYLDEKRQTLLFHATTKLVWTDKRLSWDPDQFDQVKNIAYASFALWIPDVLLSNDADPYGTRTFEHALANINSDGKVILACPSAFKVLCGMDFGDWPYDEQTCTIEFEPFTHEGTRINLKMMGDNETIAAQLLPYASSNEWNLRDVRARRVITFPECCSGEFHSVYFVLRLQRKEHFFKSLVLAPLVSVIFSSWFLFLMPLDYSLKFVLGGIQVIFVGIFAMFLKHTIPLTVDKTPHIVLMSVEALVLILLANFLQLVLQSVSRRKSPMPNHLRMFVFEGLQRLYCCEKASPTYSKPTIRVPNCEQEVDPFEMEDTGASLVLEKNKHEWTTLARYLNRFCFIVYVFTSLVIII